MCGRLPYQCRLTYDDCYLKSFFFFFFWLRRKLHVLEGPLLPYQTTAWQSNEAFKTEVSI